MLVVRCSAIVFEIFPTVYDCLTRHQEFKNQSSVVYYIRIALIAPVVRVYVLYETYSYNGHVLQVPRFTWQYQCVRYMPCLEFHRYSRNVAMRILNVWI